MEQRSYRDVVEYSIRLVSGILRAVQCNNDVNTCTQTLYMVVKNYRAQQRLI